MPWAILDDPPLYIHLSSYTTLYIFTTYSSLLLDTVLIFAFYSAIALVCMSTPVVVPQLCIIKVIIIISVMFCKSQDLDV